MCCCRQYTPRGQVRGVIALIPTLPYLYSLERSTFFNKLTHHLTSSSPSFLVPYSFLDLLLLGGMDVWHTLMALCQSEVLSLQSHQSQGQHHLQHYHHQQQQQHHQQQYQHQQQPQHNLASNNLSEAITYRHLETLILMLTSLVGNALSFHKLDSAATPP